ncbi:M20/M25/M40 family metallo-hydrolase [Streptomyces mirabilis]|nr:M20/M25/M40 family metallo-hydrolase [Streptomyces mirabilis]
MGLARRPAEGDAVVTGSHLDSVPDGGAFDGPLGVVSSFAALDELRARKAEFTRPLAIVNFGDEEGARFGLACVGSRLAAGQLTVEQAHRLTDGDGITLPQAMERAGYDPDTIGPDPSASPASAPSSNCTSSRAAPSTSAATRSASPAPSGRTAAGASTSGRGQPRGHHPARRPPRPDAVVRRDRARRPPGGPARRCRRHLRQDLRRAERRERHPSLVRGWLDSRAADQATLDTVVTGVEKAAREYAEAQGVELDVVRESFTPVVEFEHALRDELARILGKDGERAAGLTVPVLGTGAGHDAGILSGTVPTAMLFVRNPTGVSHSPAEYAAEDDCVAGVTALADVLEGLACR